MVAGSRERRFSAKFCARAAQGRGFAFPPSGQALFLLPFTREREPDSLAEVATMPLCQVRKELAKSGTRSVHKGSLPPFSPVSAPTLALPPPSASVVSVSLPL